VDKPQPLVKMTEKFRRNHAVPAQGDVQRRVFYLAQASIRIDYHVPENSLTHSYRVYTKQGRSHVVQSDPLLPPVDTIAQLEQFQQLVAAEKECMTVRPHMHCYNRMCGCCVRWPGWYEGLRLIVAHQGPQSGPLATSHIVKPCR